VREKRQRGERREQREKRQPHQLLSNSFLWGHSNGGSIKFRFIDCQEREKEEWCSSDDKSYAECLHGADSAKNKGKFKSKTNCEADRDEENWDNDAARSRVFCEHRERAYAECERSWNNFTEVCNDARDGTVTLDCIPVLKDDFDVSVRESVDGVTYLGMMIRVRVRLAMKRW